MTIDRRALLGVAAAGSALAIAPSSAAPARSYKRIACEEAFAIPETVEASRRRAKGVPSMQSGPIAGPMMPNLLDIGAGRIAQMDRDGIDIQVLAVTSPGVQNLDVSDAVPLARLANDRMAAAMKAYPKRFAGLTNIAPQDPKAAVAEIERGMRTLGMRGVMINSNTNDEYLDQEKFWPILEAAESLRAPIYIHPTYPGASIAGAAVPGFVVGWGYAVETGTHILRMIGAGVFERFPRLQVVIGHMGEMIPFVLQRIDNRYVFESSLFNRPKLSLTPSEYFKRNIAITTSGMNYEAPLRTTITEVGLDNLLFAVDYPMENQAQVVADFEAMTLTPAQKKAICETNPARVFGLADML